MWSCCYCCQKPRARVNGGFHSLARVNRGLHSLGSFQGWPGWSRSRFLSSWPLDIFAAWMAQHLKTHLLANTWQWKAYALPSNCSLPYHVYNIKKLKTPDQFYFPSSSDHSKWCVSTKNSRHQWVCIGDLNRSKYQVFRSGGFICTKNRYIYQSFYRLVVSYEPCD